MTLLVNLHHLAMILKGSKIVAMGKRSGELKLALQLEFKPRATGRQFKLKSQFTF